MLSEGAKHYQLLLPQFCFQLHGIAVGQKHTSLSQSIQQTMSRQSHWKQAPDFRDKYGNAVLANGATFCVAGVAYQFSSVQSLSHV